MPWALPIYLNAKVVEDLNKQINKGIVHAFLYVGQTL